MIASKDMNIRQQCKLSKLQMEQDALRIMLSSDKEKPKQSNMGKDSYVRQKEETYGYANYTSSGDLSLSGNRMTKEEMWDYLARFESISSEFTVKEQSYNFGDVEKMGADVLEEMKAVDNVLTLQSGNYYGVTTNDGGNETAWGMTVGKSKGMRVAGSESIYAIERDIRLIELGDWVTFFQFNTNRGNACAAGIYISLSESKVREIMGKLGFEPGMCNIKIDGKDNEFFYSNDGRLYPKYHYDGAYLGMTQGDNSRVYEPGDEFNYNGNLYTMDENGHINVPYGEDIFHCLSRPKGKYAIK